MLPSYAPAILWGAFLLFLGGRGDLPSVPVALPVDKVAHFALYGVLGWLTARGWLRQRRPAWPWPLLLALAVGLADEWNQRSVAGRMADPLDWLADAAGVSLVYILRTRSARAQSRSTG